MSKPGDFPYLHVFDPKHANVDQHSMDSTHNLLLADIQRVIHSLPQLRIIKNNFVSKLGFC